MAHITTAPYLFREETKPGEFEQFIEHLLYRLGAGYRNRGFHVVVIAVSLIYHDPEEYLTMRSKILYPKLAKLTKTTPGSVEACIRRVVKQVWDSSSEHLMAIAGQPLTERPTNSEFLDLLMHCWNMQETGDDD